MKISKKQQANLFKFLSKVLKKVAKDIPDNIGFQIQAEKRFSTPARQGLPVRQKRIVATKPKSLLDYAKHFESHLKQKKNMAVKPVKIKAKPQAKISLGTQKDKKTILKVAGTLDKIGNRTKVVKIDDTAILKTKGIYTFINDVSSYASLIINLL